MRDYLVERFPEIADIALQPVDGRMIAVIMKNFAYGICGALLAAYVSAKVFEEKVMGFMEQQRYTNGAIFERINRLENCWFGRNCK